MHKINSVVAVVAAVVVGAAVVLMARVIAIQDLIARREMIRGKDNGTQQAIVDLITNSTQHPQLRTLFQLQSLRSIQRHAKHTALLIAIEQRLDTINHRRRYPAPPMK